MAEEIRKALKAVDLMKLLDGQVALGGKSGSKNLGEHKVSKNLLPESPSALVCDDKSGMFVLTEICTVLEDTTRTSATYRLPVLNN